MTRAARNWILKQRRLSRIYHVRDDWLTPVEYLPYIDALLGDIELDPCSTHKANAEFLRAKKIYTLEEDGLNIEESWKGVTYLFPPTYGRCSYNKARGSWRWSMRAGARSQAPATAWFGRLYKEWKLRNIPEALFYTTYPEMLRTCQDVWDLPMCIPKERANLIQGGTFYRLTVPVYWGYFVYLPPPSLGDEAINRFTEIFSHIGKVVT